MMCITCPDLLRKGPGVDCPLGGEAVGTPGTGVCGLGSGGVHPRILNRMAMPPFDHSTGTMRTYCAVMSRLKRFLMGVLLSMLPSKMAGVDSPGIVVYGKKSMPLNPRKTLYFVTHLGASGLPCVITPEIRVGFRKFT